MSRLPCVNTTSIPPPTSKLSKRQSSLDFRPQPQELPLLKSSTRMSRNSVSSNDDDDDDLDSFSSRFSTFSFGSIQTTITSPRSSLVTSPKPSMTGPLRKRLSVKPSPSMPTQRVTSLQQQQQQQQQQQHAGHDGLYLDERVVVDSMNIIGTLRYLGEINIKPGIWAGIELDIVGTGKNDGSIKGVQYFKCSPETGIFVMASKVTPPPPLLDHDDISIRSISPPTPYSMSLPHINKRINGSRVERYIGMTESESLSQRQPKRLSNASTISTGSSISSGARYSRLSPPSIQSPTPTSHQRPPSRTSSASSSSSSRPRRLSSFTQQQQQHHNDINDTDDYYGQDDSVVISDEHMLTDTPVPVNLATSESTDIPTLSNSGSSLPFSATTTTTTTASTTTTQHHSHPHHLYENDQQTHLERILGQTIAQAPDETVMRLQQLYLRVQVLEAENKYLKLENTRNKTADGDKDDNDNDNDNNSDSFTLTRHDAIVKEIMQDHDTKKKTWETDGTRMQSSIKKLENRIFELETEQSEIVHERDELETCLDQLCQTKDQMEQKIQGLEQQLVQTQAAAAAAAAAAAQQQQQQPLPAVQTTANFYSSDPDEMQERQGQMEIEMDHMHNKVTSLMETIRVKDRFLGELTQQVEQHRNWVEETERQMRRVRLEGERHVREKERLRQEINDWTMKWIGHEHCVDLDAFDRLKRDYTTTKDMLTGMEKETKGLALTVEELKAAGMESIDLYENSVVLHQVAMETMETHLKDEQLKVAALQETIKILSEQEKREHQGPSLESRIEINGGKETELVLALDQERTLTRLLRQELEKVKAGGFF